MQLLIVQPNNTRFFVVQLYQLRPSRLSPRCVYPNAKSLPIKLIIIHRFSDDDTPPLVLGLDNYAHKQKAAITLMQPLPSSALHVKSHGKRLQILLLFHRQSRRFAFILHIQTNTTYSKILAANFQKRSLIARPAARSSLYSKPRILYPHIHGIVVYIHDSRTRTCDQRIRIDTKRSQTSYVKSDPIIHFK